MADGKIQPQEEKVIEQLIKEEIWHHQAYYDKHPESKEIMLTKLNFFNAAKNKITAKQAFDSYKQFFKKYGNKLNMHHRELASSLVFKVTATYKGINKEERKLVDELIASNMI